MTAQAISPHQRRPRRSSATSLELLQYPLRRLPELPPRLPRFRQDLSRPFLSRSLAPPVWAYLTNQSDEISRPTEPLARAASRPCPTDLDLYGTEQALPAHLSSVGKRAHHALKGHCEQLRLAPALSAFYFALGATPPRLADQRLPSPPRSASEPRAAEPAALPSPQPNACAQASSAMAQDWPPSNGAARLQPSQLRACASPAPGTAAAPRARCPPTKPGIEQFVSALLLSE
ncbi:Uncharacterised protein [Stenotrophomonas maltophilia]|nr:Uncharacterised protein [Stenotrophomonas maltophilia]